MVCACRRTFLVGLYRPYAGNVVKSIRTISELHDPHVPLLAELLGRPLRALEASMLNCIND